MRNLKENNDVPVSSRLPPELGLRLVSRCNDQEIDKSVFIREAIDEKLEREDIDYLEEKEKKLIKELEKLQVHKKILGQKRDESVNLSSEEISELMDAKNSIQDNPMFLEGRISRFRNIFTKPYQISRPEFFKLIEKAEQAEAAKQIGGLL